MNRRFDARRWKVHEISCCAAVMVIAASLCFENLPGACSVEVLLLGDWRAAAGEMGFWPECGHLARPTLGWESQTGRPERKRFAFHTRLMGTARPGASALADPHLPQHVATVPIRNHPDPRGLLPRVPQSPRTRELGRCNASPLGERGHAMRPSDQPRRSSLDPGTAHPNGVALAALSA